MSYNFIVIIFLRLYNIFIFVIKVTFLNDLVGERYGVLCPDLLLIVLHFQLVLGVFKLLDLFFQLFLFFDHNLFLYLVFLNNGEFRFGLRLCLIGCVIISGTYFFIIFSTYYWSWTSRNWYSKSIFGFCL